MHVTVEEEEMESEREREEELLKGKCPRPISPTCLLHFDSRLPVCPCSPSRLEECVLALV